MVELALETAGRLLNFCVHREDNHLDLFVDFIKLDQASNPMFFQGNLTDSLLEQLRIGG